ncbi:hypothetical protein ABEB36_007224 [Hypothenemus hampei]|uniref:Transposase n=1 Tax=Hypothenemus hampei TaxID=57062 RepID=A0ABD1EX77_HYPHA
MNNFTIYAERYRLQIHSTVRKFIVRRARETGNLKANGHIGSHRMLHIEEHVLDIVQEDTTINIRNIAEQAHHSQTKVWRTLYENQLHSYHF